MSKRIVTDLGDHFRDKGAHEERARIAAWLREVDVNLSVDMQDTVDALAAHQQTGADDEGATALRQVLEVRSHELTGAHGLVLVLIEKLEAEK